MKKKILSIMLTLSMLAMFMPCIASAETYGDFEYERNGSGITITKYDGNGGNIEIPAEIDGLPVTSIGDRAFDRNIKNLKNITIPDSVTSIGNSAFASCGLTSITIPGSVTNIGDHAFAGCDSLETAIMLDGVTSIADTMFNGCENLKNVTIPNSVKTIGTFAFNDCLALTNVTIPDGVTTIGDGAFHTCISLTNVTIPDSVTTIEKEAFCGCDALTNITIPNSVTSIDRQVSAPTFSVNTTINYEGTEEQWRQIYPYDDNLITVLCNGVPLTQETPEPTPAPTVKPSDEPVHPINPVPTAKPTETPQVNAFVDVPKTHWAYDNIVRITELDGCNGYEDGTFKPDNQITHEEFLTVVMKLTYKGDVNDAPTSALSANWADWAKATLNAAAQAGIVTADDTDLLAVNTPITRAEMAKIISRTLDYLGKAKATNLDTGKITDWNAIPADYQPYVAEVYAKGIISGYEDGSFGPANCLTRAEASAVIVRMIDAQ